MHDVLQNLARTRKGILEQQDCRDDDAHEASPVRAYRWNVNRRLNVCVSSGWRTFRRFQSFAIMRVVVRQDWARRPALYGLREDEFVAQGATRATRREARTSV